MPNVYVVIFTYCSQVALIYICNIWLSLLSYSSINHKKQKTTNQWKMKTISFFFSLCWGIEPRAVTMSHSLGKRRIIVLPAKEQTNIKPLKNIYKKRPVLPTQRQGGSLRSRGIPRRKPWFWSCFRSIRLSPSVCLCCLSASWGFRNILDEVTENPWYARSKYPTQLAKMSFDEIFDLTVDVFYFIYMEALL